MENKLAPRIAIYYRAAPGRYQFQAGKASGRPDWLLKVQCRGPERDCEVSAESLVEFANCSDEIEAVQAFIQSYGPPFTAERDKSNCIYSDTLGRWKALRLQFCMTWDRMTADEVRNGSVEKYGRDFPQLWKAAEARGVFRLTGAGPIFVAETLYMGMVAKLLMVASIGKLRRCLNPDCALSRYFIADHGKTQYCSEECGKWGQRKSKLKYWHEKKNETNRPPGHQQPAAGRKPKRGA